jgi:transposase
LHCLSKSDYPADPQLHHCRVRRSCQCPTISSGTIEPKPHTGGFESKLANHLDLVKQLVKQDNDATLAELCAQLEQQVEVRVSPSTLCRRLQQLNLTRKKTLHVSQAETD